MSQYSVPVGRLRREVKETLMMERGGRSVSGHHVTLLVPETSIYVTQLSDFKLEK